MAMIEGLEQRKLLSATLLRVGTVTADNRGEVMIQLSERATGVKGSAIQLYTAGPDGKLFTNDDKRETVRFTYSVNKKRITITGKLPKDTPYRVKLDGKTRIRSEASGTLLDGDFNGAGKTSGDGKAGGNFEFQVSRDRSSTPQVKLRTNNGDIIVKVRADVAPNSANQFLGMVNKGQYDNLLVTRSDAGFVVQLGALRVTGSGNTASDLVENIANPFGQELPRVLSNTRGTLSYARSGAGTATTEFFFNVGDNSNFLNEPTQSNASTFTPFAEIVNKEGFTTIDRIADKQYHNNSQVQVINPDINGDGQSVYLDRLPLNDVSTITDNTFRPARDGVIVGRAGILMLLSGK